MRSMTPCLSFNFFPIVLVVVRTKTNTVINDRKYFTSKYPRYDQQNMDEEFAA